MEDQSNDVVFKDADDVLEHFGPYGRFQFLITAALFVMSLPLSLPILMMYFAANDAPWRCVTNSSFCQLNGTMTSKNTYRCTIPREEWQYTESIHYSIITQFDLNCDKEWIAHLTTSALFIGWLLGSMPMGWVVDNFGRKKVIFSSVFCITLLKIISTFSPNIIILILIEFIVGIFIAGSVFQVIVWVSEFTTLQDNTFFVTLIIFAFPVACCILGIKAYFIRDWSHLAIICAAPYLLTLLFTFFVPESIQWLHVHHKDGEIYKIIKPIAFWNKKTLPEKYSIAPATSVSLGVRSHPIDLFRPVTMAMQSTILGWAWFVVVMVAYGFAFTANDLGGSIYLNFILVTVIGIPGIIAQKFFCDKFGSKKTVCVSMSTSCVCCLAITFIPSIGHVAIILRITCATLGRFSCILCFTSLMIWSLERYPTKIRAQAIGFFQAISRVGAAISPWVTKGLRHIYSGLPFLVMAVVSFIAICLMMMLPERRTEAVLVVDEKDEEGDILSLSRS